MNDTTWTANQNPVQNNGLMHLKYENAAHKLSENIILSVICVDANIHIISYTSFCRHCIGATDTPNK